MRLFDNNEHYETKANKGCRKVIFQPGEWVLAHLRKERFPSHRHSKLNPRGDGPFQVLERINDNAYKIDLLGEYNVSATFNVSDLSHFEVVSDSRTNLFEEGRNDENVGQNQSTKDLLQIPIGSITRARAKKLQETLNGLVKEFIWANPTFKEFDEFF